MRGRVVSDCGCTVVPSPRPIGALDLPTLPRHCDMSSLLGQPETEDLLTSCVCSAMSWTCRSSHDDDSSRAASSYSTATFSVKSVIAVRLDSNPSGSWVVRVRRPYGSRSVCGDACVPCFSHPCYDRATAISPYLAAASQRTSFPIGPEFGKVYGSRENL